MPSAEDEPWLSRVVLHVLHIQRLRLAAAIPLPAPAPFPVPSEGALQGILNETAAGLEDAAADDEDDDKDDGNLAAGRP